MRAEDSGKTVLIAILDIRRRTHGKFAVGVKACLPEQCLKMAVGSVTPLELGEPGDSVHVLVKKGTGGDAHGFQRVLNGLFAVCKVLP
ncbi:Unknown protein sequence [Pseudomonas syringae pv. aceris]|uniref:Uncharacterized protein n=1 Tax=Pseudomonas syringae pv. aceris TaxID=199198 RepID=A0A0P9IV62_PSESX|nr:Unknown protein sequence [Pseudomonas syringae pv. aceris]